MTSLEHLQEAVTMKSTCEILICRGESEKMPCEEGGGGDVVSSVVLD